MKWTRDYEYLFNFRHVQFKIQPIVYLQFTLKVNFERAQNWYAFMHIESKSVDDLLATICYHYFLLNFLFNCVSTQQEGVTLGY